jgi:sister-chromatid-cohesion protein PDS5
VLSLQIYALKALVKSFLPHRGSHGKRHINELLDILSKLLQTGYTFDGITSWYSLEKNFISAISIFAMHTKHR